MKLRDLLGNANFQDLLNDMLDPTTSKPPREKGADAIKVGGFVVHGHWRRRWHPRVDEYQPQHRGRRRRTRLTPSEIAALPKDE